MIKKNKQSYRVCFSLFWFSSEMVFCYSNCSDLLWEKIVLVIEKNFWNSRLKAENFQKVLLINYVLQFINVWIVYWILHISWQSIFGWLKRVHLFILSGKFFGLLRKMETKNFWRLKTNICTKVSFFIQCIKKQLITL